MISSIARIPESAGYFESILPETMLLSYHICHSARAEQLGEMFFGKTTPEDLLSPYGHIFTLGVIISF